MKKETCFGVLKSVSKEKEKAVKSEKVRRPSWYPQR